MKLTIGRDENTQRLKIAIEGGQTRLFGAQGSVPMSVSRQHCVLQTEDGVNYTLTNLKLQNITSVNGLVVQNKQVTDKDIITLGSQNYQLDWQCIKSLMPAVADIRPLKQIWEDYDRKSKKLVRKDKQFNQLRYSTGGLMALSGVLGVLLGRQNAIAIIPAALVFVCSLIFFIIGWKNISKGEKLKEQTHREFNHNYICPHCGRGLKRCGSYEELVRDYDACPRCRAKFIK